MNNKPINNKEQYNHWIGIGKAYLEKGWSIVPIGPNKSPIIKWEKYQTQKPILNEVASWCNRDTFMGYALVCGSGILVLDIDLGANIDGSDLPHTLTSRTGSGGRHFYFKYPPNLKIPSFTGIREKIDIRADGGVAILPPSIHPSGMKYEWITPHDTPMADIPDWLMRELQQRVGDGKFDKEILKGVPESKRNTSATQVVGKFLKHLPVDEWGSIAWPSLVGWNLQNKPPMDEKELRTTFESIAKKELQSREKEGKTETPRTTSEVLVDLLIEKGAKLFTDQFQEPCLSIPEKPFIAFKIDSKLTRRYLAGEYWRNFKEAVGPDSVKTAIATLEGIASFEKDRQLVHTRVARLEDNIVYDIGDDRHLIFISKDGWEIKENVSLFFKRHSHQKPQVLPQKGGDLKNLLKYLNVKEKAHELLLLTYLPVSLIPDIPRVLLILHGDQGSGKSSVLRLLRSLIDPSYVPLLTPPDSLRELVQLASHHFAVYFDNLSTVQGWLSDCLCRLVTGDSFAKRALYSDDDDVLYSYHRVAGFCGINQLATRPDLLDRSLIIPLERIPEEKRKEEKRLWQEFEKEKPFIFGAILDILAATLKIAPTLNISKSPRMADFYRYALAATTILGYSQNDLDEAFSQNLLQQNQEAIDASTVGQTIIEFMNRIDENPWEGNSSKLYDNLVIIADELKIKQGFPKGSNWLWRRVKEVRPNLMAYGISVHKSEYAQGSLITITKTNSVRNAAITATSGRLPLDDILPEPGISGDSGSNESHPTTVSNQGE